MTQEVHLFERELETAAEEKKAIGHFNVSSLEQFKAIENVVRRLRVPVIIGVSEGERDFIGLPQIVSLVRSLRDEIFWVYLNADHTHSLEKVAEAADAGFDTILFDGGRLSFEENIAQTEEAVRIAKYYGCDFVEGELGYIGDSSEIRKQMPEGVAIKPEDLTKPEEAARFVRETGVNLLAPAVGNVHGMFENAPEPKLDIERIRAIKQAVKIPLVLHGASGNTDEDLLAAIQAGISIVHISTELRLVWRRGLEKSLKEKPEEIAPYKIESAAIEEMEKLIEHKLKLFNKI